LKGEGGAGEVLARAKSALESIADMEPTAPGLVDRLSSVAVEVADIVEELSRTHVQADPSALAAARERLALLSRLIRKYGVSEEEVLAFLDTAQRRVSELEGSSHDEATLTSEIASLEDIARRKAEALSKLRNEAARSLEGRIEGVLKDLSLGDARFEVALTPTDLYQGGLESVGFLIAANLGESPKPIGKVASGGELSRIALALRLLTSTGTATTLVFDEVDAGVGGEAARSVGRLLAELGERENTQVLVVTHLPQVAAFADHQYRVLKRTAEARTASLVEPVTGEARVEELSRMLAGLPESERAREHAQELLELAGRNAR
jgi:DNA repair protein RecN (Recombination protein N)